MRDIKRRLAALEQLLAPEIDYIELCGYFSRQIDHMEKRLGFPEPPPGMRERVPKGYEYFCFLFGSNEKEWDECMAARAVQLQKMMGMLGEVTE